MTDNLLNGLLIILWWKWQRHRQRQRHKQSRQQNTFHPQRLLVNSLKGNGQARGSNWLRISEFWGFQWQTLAEIPSLSLRNKVINRSISALEILKNHTIPQFQPNFMMCVSRYRLQLEKYASIVPYHVLFQIRTFVANWILTLDKPDFIQASD